MIRRYPTPKYYENTYLIVKEGYSEVLLVDPGAVMNEIDDYLEREDKQVIAILLTHGHADHIMGVEHYAKKGVKIYAHEDEKEILEDAAYNYSELMLGREIKITEATFVFDAQTLRLGPFSVEVIHTPGHTKGGVCYLIDEQLLSGDTLFRESVGRTDLYSGSMKELTRSITQKLFSLPAQTTLYPGHGPTSTIEHEKKHNPFV